MQALMPRVSGCVLRKITRRATDYDVKNRVKVNGITSYEMVTSHARWRMGRYETFLDNKSLKYVFDILT